MNSPTLTVKGRPQSLEAVAYFEGAHGIELKPGLDRIQATFDQKAAELGYGSVAREKKHEETHDRADVLMPDAEKKASAINAHIGDERPQAFMPAVCLMAALFMAAGEVELLAPALDVLSVTNPTLQTLTAIGIMCVSCLAFHFAWDSFTSNRFPRVLKIIARLTAGVIAIFLVVWGILRGAQVAFASDLTDNPLGRFLSGHPILAAVFYIFVTLAVPLVVASAMHFGIHHLRDWWEWKKANANLQAMKEVKVNAAKQLETEREQQKQGLKQLAEECAQWKATYQIHHERGRQHGAEKEPLWRVVLKSCVVSIVGGALLLVAGPVAAGTGALVGGIAAFVHFWHKREHPTPEQYYRAHKVQFMPQTRNLSVHPEKPLLEAKSEPSRPKKGLPE
jgi:hypothetical protein